MSDKLHPAPDGATVTASYYEREAMEREIAKHRRLLEAAPAMASALKAFVATADDYALLPYDNDAIRKIKGHAIQARAALAKADALEERTRKERT